MPLAGVDSLVAALIGAKQERRFIKGSSAVGAAFSDLFLRAGQPGAGNTPPAAPGEIPTRLTPGALPFTNPPAGLLTYLAGLECHGINTGTLLLIDRLWHCTFDGSITTPQTINSPPLTRLDAGGMDTELWVGSINSTTNPNATFTYTNAQGVTGRVSQVAATGSGVLRVTPVPLAAGDSGIQSVQSVSLSGNAGAGTLMQALAIRRLAEVGFSTMLSSDRDGLSLGMPRIYDDSCLSMLWFHATTAASTVGRVQLVQA